MRPITRCLEPQELLVQSPPHSFDTTGHCDQISRPLFCDLGGIENSAGYLSTVNWGLDTVALCPFSRIELMILVVSWSFVTKITRPILSPFVVSVLIDEGTSLERRQTVESHVFGERHTHANLHLPLFDEVSNDPGILIHTA